MHFTVLYFVEVTGEKAKPTGSVSRSFSGPVLIHSLGVRESRELLLNPRSKDARLGRELCDLIERGEAVLIVARRKGARGGSLIASLLGFRDRADLVVQEPEAGRARAAGSKARRLLKGILRRMVDLWIEAKLDRPSLRMLAGADMGSDQAGVRSLLSRIRMSVN